MTTFREVKDSEEGTWFPYFSSHFDTKKGEVIYDDPLPGAAEFRIRNLIPFFTERRNKRKRTHQMVLNTATKQMERVSFYEDLPAADAKKEQEDSWDYAITGMKNARWEESGPEMECTRENKIKLMNSSSAHDPTDKEFDRFLARCLFLLAGIEKKDEEKAEKN